MVTKIAPTYASLIMGFPELKMYETIDEMFDKKFRHNIANSICCKQGNEDIKC